MLCSRDMILRKQIRATKLSQPRATRQRWPKTNLAPRRNHARPFVYTAGGHGTEHPRLHKNANGCMIGKHKTHPPYYPSATNTESNGPMHYLVFLEAWSPLLSWATQCLPTISRSFSSEAPTTLSTFFPFRSTWWQERASRRGKRCEHVRAAKPQKMTVRQDFKDNVSGRL